MKHQFSKKDGEKLPFLDDNEKNLKNKNCVIVGSSGMGRKISKKTKEGIKK